MGGGGIPADTNPPQPDNGKQWVDTSQSPPEVKIYDSATQAWLPADTKATVVSQTKPTPEVGKIWFEPAQDGTNMYAASSDKWEFLKFLPAIPDSSNLHMRYDAVDQSASGSVSTIVDHTNGNDLTGTASYQSSGLNGAPTFDFDDSNGDNMTVSSLHQNLSPPYTIYVVSRLDDGNIGNNHSPWAESNSGGPRIRTRAGGSQSVRDGNGNAIKYADTDMQPHIEVGVFNGSSSLASREDVSPATGTLNAPTLNSFALSSSSEELWDGAISACWVFDGAHNSSTRSDVFSILESRYGFN